jgi:hypothetical protein
MTREDGLGGTREMYIQTGAQDLGHEDALSKQKLYIHTKYIF